jgi:aminopeptidase YwaD
MLGRRHVAVVAMFAAIFATGTVPVGDSPPGSAARPSALGERALATVRQLARERPAGSAGEAAVARIVAGRLRSLGYRVVEQRFPLPRGGTSRNVLGLSSGRVRVVIAAHLDGVSGSPAANDNASGVAVMLELARALRGREGVLVAGLGAEERRETGSRFHLGALRLARGLSPQGKRLVVVLDMVGVGVRLHVRGIESRPNRSARVLLRGGGTYLRDPGHSDHAELTRAGISAAWVQWREDACWHRPCDRPIRVDARKLQTAYDLVLRAARSALESP